MSTAAHEELRARLDDCRKAVSVYESPDPYDREEARYEAMHAAQARLCDLALAEALLDEIDTLRAERDAEHTRSRNAKALLRRVVKYAREDGAETPGSTRLARVVAQIEDGLSRDATTADILRATPPEAP